MIDTRPPLSLYVHIPWCVRKCPYCDFNSHAVSEPIDERAFIDALLSDFAQERRMAADRPLISIFIGGGTPSLLSGAAIGRLICGLEERSVFAEDIEITLEANPGTAEAQRFRDYRSAGVNRLSIGAQSFDAQKLSALARIHSADEARAAMQMARDAGFDNINLDLMFGLPDQTLAQAKHDVDTAITLRPQHISYYQLTLEPNTLFHSQPPKLPDDERIWDIQQQGQDRLAQAGFEQYEISAYASEGKRCRHNLNYWRFGDYLGIGPGAHGKLTDHDGVIRRRWKRRSPADYLAASAQGRFLSGARELDEQDACLEFLMNSLRLKQGFAPDLFTARTHLPLARLESSLSKPQKAGLVTLTEERVCPTTKGYDFLNELLAMLD